MLDSVAACTFPIASDDAGSVSKLADMSSGPAANAPPPSSGESVDMSTLLNLTHSLTASMDKLGQESSSPNQADVAITDVWVDPTSMLLSVQPAVFCLVAPLLSIFSPAFLLLLRRVALKKLWPANSTP